MALARRRLDEGFAFVGLTEEWPLSICLFVTMFQLPCRRELMNNTRLGDKYSATRAAVVELRNHNRTSPDEYRSLLPFRSAFADPNEMTFYGWVQERFAHDLARHRLTPSACAAEVCPEAAEYFSHHTPSLDLASPRTPRDD